MKLRENEIVITTFSFHWSTARIDVPLRKTYEAISDQISVLSQKADTRIGRLPKTPLPPDLMRMPSPIPNVRRPIRFLGQMKFAMSVESD